MAEKKAEVPTNRCGFELHPDDVGFDDSRSGWVEETNPVCCWRSVWESHDETDRCIWHADVDEKPLAELIAARTDSSERLDGAILRNIQIEGEGLSLGDCPLRGARFDHSRLQDSDFTDAELRWADFTNADLLMTDFTDADLEEVDFTGANLTRADFTDTTSQKVHFTDSSPVKSDFTDANLFRADFTTASPLMADFTDAYLQQANFTDAYLQEADFSHADARWASFRHATLQDAVFTHTDCRETTFTSALLYEAVFSDTRINSQTTFFDPTTTFYESITSRPGCVYEENPLTTNPIRSRLIAL